jgi:hypothetical protein
MLKIGFELNGLYWHSDLYKEKNYHIDKLNHFKKKKCIANKKKNGKNIKKMDYVH